MAFTRTWNASYEADPANGDDASGGALDIRSVKIDIRERLEIDHVMDETANDGKHTKVTMPVLVSAPTQIASTGILYTKDVGAKAELFFIDEDGNEVQLTSAGAGDGFPTGTLMLFQQTAAPTGWTKETTHNDKAFRVVSGAASSGGSVTFTGVFNTTRATTNNGAHTHTANSAGAHSHTITVDNHTLTVAEMPSHRHRARGTSTSDNDAFGLRSSQNGFAGESGTTNGYQDAGASGQFIENTGSGSAHNHTGSSNSTGAHTHSTDSQGAHTHTSNLAVQYVDIIIAAKD